MEESERDRDLNLHYRPQYSPKQSLSLKGLFAWNGEDAFLYPSAPIIVKLGPFLICQDFGEDWNTKSWLFILNKAGHYWELLFWGFIEETFEFFAFIHFDWSEWSNALRKLRDSMKNRAYNQKVWVELPIQIKVDWKHIWGKKRVLFISELPRVLYRLQYMLKFSTFLSIPLYMVNTRKSWIIVIYVLGYCIKR